MVHPFLDSHPDQALAKKQMVKGGTTLAIQLDGGKEEAFRFMNGLEVIDISNNLGDARSLATHPASTTHHRLGPEIRELMGIGEGVVRISVGLEHPSDLLEDVRLAL